MRNILIKFIRDRISEKHSDQRYRLQTLGGGNLDLPETGDTYKNERLLQRKKKRKKKGLVK